MCPKVYHDRHMEMVKVIGGYWGDDHEHYYDAGLKHGFPIGTVAVAEHGGENTIECSAFHPKYPDGEVFQYINQEHLEVLEGDAE